MNKISIIFLILIQYKKLHKIAIFFQVLELLKLFMYIEDVEKLIIPNVLSLLIKLEVIASWFGVHFILRIGMLFTCQERINSIIYTKMLEQVYQPLLDKIYLIRAHQKVFYFNWTLLQAHIKSSVV